MLIGSTRSTWEQPQTCGSEVQSQRGSAIHSWENQIDGLTESMIGVELKAPRLKWNASGGRGLIPIALDMANARLSDVDAKSTP